MIVYEYRLKSLLSNRTLTSLTVSAREPSIVRAVAVACVSALAIDTTSTVQARVIWETFVDV